MFKENITDIPQQELEAIILGDVIGEEMFLTEEQLMELNKYQEIHKENICKISKFKYFSRTLSYCKFDLLSWFPDLFFCSLKPKSSLIQNSNLFICGTKKQI